MAWFRRNKKSKLSTAPAAPPQAPADMAAPEEAAEPVEASGDAGASASAEADALIERWDAAIADIRQRFATVLAQATAGSEPLINATESDLTPLTLPWNTIDPQRHTFGEEVSDVWDDVSDEMSDCDGFSHEMMDREGNKRDATVLEIELDHLQAYGDVMTRAAERMRQAALATDAANHECQRCGAKLDKVSPVSEALNVKCGYCDAMNTVDPGTAMRMFAAMGALHLAEHAARSHRVAMMRAEHLIDEYRDNKDVPLSLLEEFEGASSRYYTTRLTVEAQHNPELQKHIEMKLARHTKDANRKLKQYWQWRQRPAQ